jgi:DNA-binding XRE family transcriptional regulator
VAEPTYGPGVEPIEVAPVVVLSQIFPARPSSIPDIRNFVRHCLSESPLTEEGMREVGETVFRALLDAAGPTGSINVAFRIFPEHVEVDVLHSDSALTSDRSQAASGPAGQGHPATPVSDSAARSAALSPASPINLGTPSGPATFAEWMSSALRSQNMTQEAAARQLGVSVKTISRWVGGTTEPRMRDLRRIQEVFGSVPLNAGG